MRDSKQLSGSKRRVDTIEAALGLVRDKYPGATKDGSIGSWSFHLDGNLVAEAWLPDRGPGWWLRIRHKVREVEGENYD